MQKSEVGGKDGIIGTRPEAEVEVGGERNEEEKKGYNETTIHSSWNFTGLLERESWRRGPRAFIYRSLTGWQAGMCLPTGILAALALHRVRKRSRSSRVPLIACAAAPQGASREGEVGCRLSNVGQRLTAMQEWTRARVVSPGAGGAHCHWLQCARALKAGHLPCTGAE